MTASESTDDASPDDEPVSDEKLAELDKPLRELLGIPENYAPDHLAPPVDRRQILAFVRNELTGGQRQEVLDMITTFRSWRDALLDVLRGELDTDD